MRYLYKAIPKKVRIVMETDNVFVRIHYDLEFKTNQPSNAFGYQQLYEANDNVYIVPPQNAETFIAKNAPEEARDTIWETIPVEPPVRMPCFYTGTFWETDAYHSFALAFTKWAESTTPSLYRHTLRDDKKGLFTKEAILLSRLSDEKVRTIEKSLLTAKEIMVMQEFLANLFPDLVSQVAKCQLIRAKVFGPNGVLNSTLVEEAEKYVQHYTDVVQDMANLLEDSPAGRSLSSTTTMVPGVKYASTLFTKCEKYNDYGRILIAAKQKIGLSLFINFKHSYNRKEVVDALKRQFPNVEEIQQLTY